jgi:D-tyrosyl-tRNA(Tyr) deacylase
MKAVIQRVSSAAVEVDGQIVASIGPGILTFLGVHQGDTEAQAQKLITKILELRIFEDAQGKMNHSLLETQGEHLIVSQFTLAADTASGRRPSFIRAERPAQAQPLWEGALKTSQSLGIRTQGGIFQADMKISLVNQGPVTFVLDA